VARSIASRSLLLALLALALAAAPAAAVPTITGEFTTPNIDTNNKIIEGPDGNIWLTLSEAGKDVAKVTPAGVVTPYNIEAVTPSGIAVGPEGRIWVTRNGGVVTFLPSNPEATKATTAVAEIGTAHSIVRGPDGNMWVATNGKVLRIQASDPTKVTPFPVAGLEPKDIDAAGSLLAVADASGEPRIVTLTTAGTVTEYKIPGGSQGVAGAPNGQIAFSQQAKTPEQVGLISPPTLLPLIETPGGIGDPFGATFASDGAYWFAMSGFDGLARLTPSGTLTQLNGFPKLSFPRQLAPGPGNTLWVTLDLIDKVGRVSGLEPPLTPPPPVTIPTTKIDKGPKGVVKTTKNKAKVSFKFSSSDPAAGFQCRVIALTPKGTGKKKAGSSKKPKIKLPAFKACKSPRSYKLKPGRYRFQVRAVNAAGADATPAKRSFEVVRVFPID
jgi:virginiamycin B lyase